MKSVEINFFTDGSTKIEASGFKGNSCSLATKELELVLVGNNASAIDKKPKPDFYAQNPGTNAVSNGR